MIVHALPCLLALRFYGTWECAFSGPFDEATGHDSYGFADGCDSAPLAICRAALAAAATERPRNT